MNLLELAQTRTQISLNVPSLIIPIVNPQRSNNRTLNKTNTNFNNITPNITIPHTIITRITTATESIIVGVELFIM